MGLRLTFRHNFNLEAPEQNQNVGYDGGVLEVSSDGGNTFQDILAAHGSFVVGGYNRTSLLIAAVQLLVGKLGVGPQMASSRLSWTFQTFKHRVQKYDGVWRAIPAVQAKAGG